MTMNKLSQLIFLWLIGQLSCLTFQGHLWDNPDGVVAGTIQALTGYSVVSSGGWNVVQVGIGFVINGLPRLLFWTYPFLMQGLGIYIWLFLNVIWISGIFGVWQSLRGS